MSQLLSSSPRRFKYNFAATLLWLQLPTWFDSWQMKAIFSSIFLEFSRRSALVIVSDHMALKQMSESETQLPWDSLHAETSLCMHNCSLSGNQSWDNRGSFFLGSLSEAGLILLLPLESQQVAVLINGAWLLSSGKSAHRPEHNHTHTATSALHSRTGAGPPLLSQKAGTDKCVNFQERMCVCVYTW